MCIVVYRIVDSVRLGKKGFFVTVVVSLRCRKRGCCIAFSVSFAGSETKELPIS